MPVGRVNYSGMPIGGTGQPNIMGEVGKRWLALQNAQRAPITAAQIPPAPPANPQADVAMAQLFGMPGAPAGLEAIPPMHPRSPIPPRQAVGPPVPLTKPPAPVADTWAKRNPHMAAGLGGFLSQFGQSMQYG